MNSDEARRKSYRGLAVFAGGWALVGAASQVEHTHLSAAVTPIVSVGMLYAGAGYGGWHAFQAYFLRRDEGGPSMKERLVESKRRLQRRHPNVDRKLRKLKSLDRGIKSNLGKAAVIGGTLAQGLARLGEGTGSSILSVVSAAAMAGGAAYRVKHTERAKTEAVEFDYQHQLVHARDDRDQHWRARLAAEPLQTAPGAQIDDLARSALPWRGCRRRGMRSRLRTTGSSRASRSSEPTGTAERPPVARC